MQTVYSMKPSLIIDESNQGWIDTPILRAKYRAICDSPTCYPKNLRKKRGKESLPGQLKRSAKLSDTMCMHCGSALFWEKCEK